MLIALSGIGSGKYARSQSFSTFSLGKLGLPKTLSVSESRFLQRVCHRSG